VGDDAAVATAATTYADEASLHSSAVAFTTAWARRTLPAADWLAGLQSLSTTRLLDLLTGVDPLDVPAVAVIGPPIVVLRSDQYAQVRVPIDTAAVLLGIVKHADHWLVDSIDQVEA
jgi:hypothetical protein